MNDYCVLQVHDTVIGRVTA